MRHGFVSKFNLSYCNITIHAFSLLLLHLISHLLLTLHLIHAIIRHRDNSARKRKGTKMENLDIWHKFEKQGNRVVHTIRTRNTNTAKAMIVAPELIDSLMLILATAQLNETNIGNAGALNELLRDIAGMADAALTLSKGE